ncbi:hypothetical protein T439DRAFT_351173 [Meredithblackwellia eburnea MCA 4105]
MSSADLRHQSAPTTADPILIQQRIECTIAAALIYCYDLNTILGLQGEERQREEEKAKLIANRENIQELPNDLLRRHRPSASEQKFFEELSLLLGDSMSGKNLIYDEVEKECVSVLRKLELEKQGNWEEGFKFDYRFESLRKKLKDVLQNIFETSLGMRQICKIAIATNLELLGDHKNLNLNDIFQEENLNLNDTFQEDTGELEKEIKELWDDSKAESNRFHQAANWSRVSRERIEVIMAKLAHTQSLSSVSLAQIRLECTITIIGIRVFKLYDLSVSEKKGCLALEPQALVEYLWKRNPLTKEGEKWLISLPEILAPILKGEGMAAFVLRSGCRSALEGVPPSDSLKELFDVSAVNQDDESSHTKVRLEALHFSLSVFVKKIIASSTYSLIPATKIFIATTLWKGHQWFEDHKQYDSGNNFPLVQKKLKKVMSKLLDEENKTALAERITKAENVVEHCHKSIIDIERQINEAKKATAKKSQLKQ